jgi:dolichol-phosphate mannosyltransferase
MQIIIPALNEEEGIGLTIAELKERLGIAKILLVDGKSVDRTAEIAKNLGAEIVFQDGTGKGDALAKAIKCIDIDTDYVIITDADFTYPAEYIPEMIQILETNPSVGMVCGNRFTEDLDSHALHDLLYLGNRMIAIVHNFLNGERLVDPLTGLRVVRSEIIRNWRVKSKGFDFEIELNYQVVREGFSIVEIPIKYRERLGKKKLQIKHGFTILKRILAESVTS